MGLLNSCFGGRIAEGYGMTETSCVISSMDESDNLTGHVGSPNPACGESSILVVGVVGIPIMIRHDIDNLTKYIHLDLDKIKNLAEV